MSEEMLTIELPADAAAKARTLARDWGVSEQEAVVRALAAVEAPGGSSRSRNQLEAFEALQKASEMTPERAAAWKKAIYEARR